MTFIGLYLMFNFKRIIIFFLALTSLNVYCEEVVMIFGKSLAPYIIEESNSGVELSIIKEALALEGHALVPVYTQLNRVVFMFDQDKADAAHRYIKQGKIKSSIFYGDVTLEYHDAFFTLHERNISIESPADLKDHSLLSFQSAKSHYPKWLPEDYKHSQTSSQINQVKLLQLGLVDIVLSDKNIFNYNAELYRLSLNGELKGMRMHNFTSPYKYNPIFKREEIAQAFNAGLDKLKKSGRYTEIISKALQVNSAVTSIVDLKL
jgi:polar amino acid transport system substrate-binding protein